MSFNQSARDNISRVVCILHRIAHYAYVEARRTLLNVVHCVKLIYTDYKYIHRDRELNSIMELHFGYGITEWVFMIHTNINNNYEMVPFELDPDGYAYHSYADILKAILPHIQTNDIMDWMRSKLDINKFGIIAHAAWCSNYIRWKNRQYTKVSNDHAKGINTAERNDRATTEYKHLNKNDLGLYNDIINEVFDILSKRIIEQAMQSLTVS